MPSPTFLRRNLWTALILTVGLSGCSWITEFVVLNQTGRDLQVAYQVLPRPQEDNVCARPAGQELAPTLKSVQAARKQKGNWEPLSPLAFQCDPSSGIVRFVLADGFAFLMEQRVNYSHPPEGREAEASYRLGWLELQGEGLEAQVCKNPEIYLCFRKEKLSLYLLDLR